MKNFFSHFLGSLVGVVLAAILCTLIFAGIVVSGFKSAFHFGKDKEFKVKANSVLLLKFDKPVKERKDNNPFAELGMNGLGGKGAICLADVLKGLDKAEKDTAIKGVFIDLTEEPVASAATIEEVRNALVHFKSSKKFVYAYAETYSQKGYYLASVADKVYMHPEGEFMFKGLSSQVMYFKNMLEKMDVQMQVFRHGKFKSAVEPFLLDKMSEPNRLQLETLLNSIWNTMLQDISKDRGISVAELQSLADELKINFPADAQEYKLVDELKYQDEVTDMLKKKLGIREKDKIRYVDAAEYGEHDKKDKHKKDKKEEKGKDKLAVVYAVGEIKSGKGDDESIGSETTAKAIRDARLDSTVKIIVLRVNSPGGSALASDVIWREVTLAKKVKPVIVSMGDVAASGGYYISCAANRIFAEPNTITGSIGVFGLMPNAQKLFSEKLGIHIDTVNTNKHSDVGTLFRPVSPMEGEYIQRSVEQVYGTFTKRVAEGRGMTQAEVDSIGQGRVWSGTDALRIKLVDEMGGLREAVEYAIKDAKLKEGEFEIVALPRQKNPLDELLKGAKNEEEVKALQKHFGVFYNYMKSAQTILHAKGVQARMPFDMVIE